MKPVAWGLNDGTRIVLRTTPKTGWRPLVWGDAPPPPPKYDREVVERMAEKMGWSPPPDQVGIALDFLATRPKGATAKELRAVVRFKNILRALNPLRVEGRVKCWPVKGRGSVWFLVENEAHIQRAWTEKQLAAKKAESAAALAKYWAKRSTLAR